MHGLEVYDHTRVYGLKIWKYADSGCGDDDDVENNRRLFHCSDRLTMHPGKS
jgi:hypothetical protein